MCVTPKKVLYPSQWRTECPPERFVEGGGLRHSWEFFTGGASDVAQRRVWRVLRAPLSWKEEGCRLAEAFKWGPGSDDTLQSD